MVTRFSHSRLNSFETCPLRYKFAYIDKVKVEVEDTVETFLGSRVHEALEKLYRNLQFEKHPTLDEVLAFYNKEWRKNWYDGIIIVKKEYTEDNYRKMGERYIRDYYKRHSPFTRGRILGLETTDTLALDDAGRYGFHIRIDRLMDVGSGCYEVHDYKTNLSLPRQEDLDKDRQLAMYALWVKEQFKDFKKVRLVWHFVAFDKELESFRTESQLEELKNRVLEEIAEIESMQEFPARVTRLCNWCLYQRICPEWKHEIRIEEKPVNEFLDDPGVKLVDEYVRVKSELDEYKNTAEQRLFLLKEGLIAFCEREGLTVVSGSEYKISFNKKESFKFPAKNSEERAKLIAFLRDAGRLDEVSDLDVHALSNILKKGDWEESLLVELKGFTTTEILQRLSISKRKKKNT
ncbi:MAG: PD-(D/E)XK nuclease family protein [Candidatus Aminicenantes bacterium]|nr:PD-(D/E)XK nuclease family protein [Candidatus Aminicenantes bacterium]